VEVLVSVVVITDSAASLPPADASALGITIVPLTLTIGDRTVQDGQVDLGTIVERAGAGVSTAAPSPGRFLSALVEAGPPEDGAVIVTVASTMSATANAAMVAARTADVPVRVVDSNTAAGAEGLVALAAARTAAAGGDIDAVEAAATSVAARVRLVATVANLTQLAKSGRVPEAAAWVGHRLGLQPLFEFRNGHAKPCRPARSRSRALERILDEFAGTPPPGCATAHLVALHALCPEAAHDLLERARARSRCGSAHIAEFSPAMIAHTGPDVVGLAWWWEDGTSATDSKAQARRWRH
jgi:DegV family protein with EDD domain